MARKNWTRGASILITALGFMASCKGILGIENGHLRTDAGSTSCQNASDCAAGEACSSGECRAQCSASNPTCPGGQKCAGGVCVSAGSDAGNGGSGGTNADASGGSGGGGAGGAAGGAGGGNGDLTVGTVGQPCATNGAYACAGHAQRGQLICDRGYWAGNGTCPTGNNCDTSAGNVGFCSPIVSECAGQSPGTTFCRNTERFSCGVDLVTADSIETCPYVCSAGQCTGECRPGDADCSGGGDAGGGLVPRTCRSDGTWLDETPCGYLCAAASASCVAATCGDGVKNGNETDVDCGGSCGATCAVTKACLVDGDCALPASGKCTSNECAAATCSDAVKNGGETDVDCGGSCGATCSVNQTCSVNGDCKLPDSGKCTSNKCAAATCSDAVKNGSETDVDCGGSCSNKCTNSKSCSTDTDCVSQICSPTSKQCQTPTCSDGVKNGSETDVDCGGSCGGSCGVGKQCSSSADCALPASGVCVNGTCAAATCSDGVKNGSETAADCGGSTCAKCAAGSGCTANSDCSTGVCSQTTKLCQPATCSDGVKNAAETDVDCGGNCSPCPNGKTCSAATDCVSSVCSGTPKTCQTPACSDGVKNGTETDVDCGGSCTTKCADGESCSVAADCVSAICSSTTKLCLADGSFYTSGTWHGYVWTGVSPTSTTITPTSFVNHTVGTPFCVSGSVAGMPDYSGAAMLGWNVNQAEGSTQVLTVTPTMSGIRVDVTINVGSPLRLYIASSSTTWWCATLPTVSASTYIPFTSFNTRCWDGSGTVYNGQVIQDLYLAVPGNTTATPFNFCLNGVTQSNN